MEKSKTAHVASSGRHSAPIGSIQSVVHSLRQTRFVILGGEIAAHDRRDADQKRGCQRQADQAAAQQGWFARSHEVSGQEHVRQCGQPPAPAVARNVNGLCSRVNGLLAFEGGLATPATG